MRGRKAFSWTDGLWRYSFGQIEDEARVASTIPLVASTIPAPKKRGSERGLST